MNLKKIIVITLVITTIGFYQTSIRAAELTAVIDDYQISMDGTYIYQFADGTTAKFDNEEDLNNFLENQPKKQRACSPGDPYYPTCSKPQDVISTTTKQGNPVLTKKKFIGYHVDTKSWTKASSYSLSTSRAFSVSSAFNSNGWSGNISVSITKGVTVNIPANTKRLSRLGIYADISVQKYKVVVKDKKTKKVIRTYYYSTSKVTNTYILVKYQ